MPRNFGRRQRIAVGAAVCIMTGAVVWLATGRASSPHNAAAVSPDTALPRLLERVADSLDIALAHLANAVDARRVSGSFDSAAALRVRAAYRDARTQYKHLEGMAEFYAPALAAALNSRRQEVDDDDAPPPATLAPGGFPALEPLLWPAVRPDAAVNLRRIVPGMRHVVRQIREIGVALSPSDAQLIEVARLELTRITTLGIAGFDAPVTHAAMSECADALDGVQTLYRVAAARRWPALGRERLAFDDKLQQASAFLRAHTDFDTFDRLGFIVGYAIPAAHALDDIRRMTRTVPIAMKRGWRADAASVYDPGAFDARAYAADNAPPATDALITLGQRLFSDPSLSGSGARSCASCHHPSRAFTDGLVRAVRMDGRGPIARHTPTLLNAALSPAQFADERAITLEEQAKRVVESPTEMGGSLDRAASMLATRPDYVSAFREAFAGGTVAGQPPIITPSQIRFALAAFVRSLEAMDSRFDRALRGDTAQLSPVERRGFTLFMGKAGCGTCHFAPLFNGNTPPLYLSADVEVIGTPASSVNVAVPDADSGRAGVDHVPLHFRAFKTPTVRNAALTAPYMHNGALRSLDDVLRFYDNGGGVGAGARIGNQTLSPERLALTDDERRAVVAFIGALTDTMPAGRVRR